MVDESKEAHQAVRLEHATIAWNGGEAVLTVGLGIAAGSLALIAFGVDSVVEIFASVVVVWHLRSGHVQDVQRTRRALRLVSVAFIALAVVLVVAATRDLLAGRHAGTSIFGIIYLAVTAIVMFLLAGAKKRLADRTGAAPLRAEATMTYLDGILSVATLVGLTLNAAFAWWWADPIAALLVALAAMNEGRVNWKEATEVAG